MIDIQFIRDNPELVQEKSKQKGYKVDTGYILELDQDRLRVIPVLEQLRREHNDMTRELKGKKPTENDIRHGREYKEKISKEEARLKEIEDELIPLLAQVPNMPLEDVPVGASEDENIVTKTVGEKPEFDFEPKNHAQIAEAKGWLDKERAAKVAGARFAYIKGDLVKLQWALMQFGMDRVTDEEFLKKLIQANDLTLSSKPFNPVLPPLMINTAMYQAMDRLEPRDDRYKVEEDDLWLQGSAEHVLGSMHADEIFDHKDLPIRYVGYATSFRREAGTYGKDMEGIIRMHQFDKLEMESITDNETAYDEHKLQIAIQEALMQELGLPYQLLNKCTADIGKPNAHGVDIDVWLPGQDKYRETHTADYMTDYQSRRLKMRYKTENGTELAHTNDATVFSQRPLIAIIENYQTKEGNVRIPEALQPYMNGKREI